MEQLLPGSLDVPRAKADLANIVRFLGRHDEELPLRREVLECYSSSLPSKDPTMPRQW